MSDALKLTRSQDEWIANAHIWLKRHSAGDYHRDLGLFVDFITDAFTEADAYSMLEPKEEVKPWRDTRPRDASGFILCEKCGNRTMHSGIALCYGCGQREEAKPEADAEGWIVRIPTDPIPDPKKVTGVRFYDGVEHSDGRWPDECWTHSPNIARTVYITHYKPA